MARPKGSKNKKEPVEVVTALPEVIEDPKPVPPPAKKCRHDKGSHFGGPFAELGGWCHEHGCDCMRYSNCQP